MQSTNDGRALAGRAEILSTCVTGYVKQDPLAGLDGIPDGEPPEREEADES